MQHLEGSGLLAQIDHGWKHIHLGIYTETGGCDCSLKELLMLAQTDHSWKHIHLGIYTETRGCDCSLKELLMMSIIMPKTS
jgi:hypothetical protein